MRPVVLYFVIVFHEKRQFKMSNVQQLRALRCITAAVFLDIKGAYDSPEHAAIPRKMV